MANETDGDTRDDTQPPKETTKGGTLVRYKGASDSRDIDAADFKSMGVEGQRKVVWNADNDRVVEVSSDAAATLVEQLPREFELA